MNISRISTILLLVGILMMVISTVQAQEAQLTANDDHFPTSAGTTSFDGNVLGNDNYPQGSKTWYHSGPSPSGSASVNVNQDGSFTLNISSDFEGTISFEYLLDNSELELSDTATVTVTVGDIISAESEDEEEPIHDGPENCQRWFNLPAPQDHHVWARTGIVLNGTFVPNGDWTWVDMLSTNVSVAMPWHFPDAFYQIVWVHPGLDLTNPTPPTENTPPQFYAYLWHEGNDAKCAVVPLTELQWHEYQED